VDPQTTSIRESIKQYLPTIPEIDRALATTILENWRVHFEEASVENLETLVKLPFALMEDITINFIREHIKEGKDQAVIDGGIPLINGYYKFLKNFGLQQAPLFRKPRANS